MNFYNPQEELVYVLFYHDVQRAQPIDILVNDRPIARGLSYRQMTDYLPLPAGMYTVKIYSGNQLLLSENLEIDSNQLIRVTSPDGDSIKLVVEKEPLQQQIPSKMGYPYQPQPYPQQDMYQQPWQLQQDMYQQPWQPQQGMYQQPWQLQQDMYQQPWQPQVPKERDKKITKNAQIRFIHLSPNAPTVDITLPDGTPVFENVPYKGVTAYQNIALGTYTLQVRPSGTDTVVLTIPNFKIGPNEVKTIYAVGLVNGTPGLETFVLNDRIIRE